MDARSPLFFAPTTDDLAGGPRDERVAFVVAQLDAVSVRRLCRRARVADNGFVESPEGALERAFRGDLPALLDALYSPELVRVLEALPLELPGVPAGHLGQLAALDRAALRRLAAMLL